MPFGLSTGVGMILVGKCVIALSLMGVSAILVREAAPDHALRLNHPVLMARRVDTSESTMLAVLEEKLSKMDRESQAGEDDRKVLYAAIATLTDRINVDEAAARAGARVFGWLFSLFTGTSTLVAILEFRRRKT